jgi:hypothetical protein
MRVIAIDPGATRSGYVWYISDREMPVRSHGDIDNEALVQAIRAGEMYGDVVIEWTRPRGQLASREMFDTLFWAGRFYEAASRTGYPTSLIRNDEVRVHHVGKHNASDAAMHAVLWDRFGGSMSAAKGNVRKPGPLHGFSGNDEYDALALALTYIDRKEARQP